MTAEIRGINYTADIAITAEGVVDRVKEKHEEFMEEIDDPRGLQMWEKEVLREHRDYAVLVEYPFWSHRLSVRCNPHDSDDITVHVYQNVPMKDFQDTFEDFCREILDIEPDFEIRDLDREYLDKVEGSVKVLKSAVKTETTEDGKK